MSKEEKAIRFGCISCTEAEFLEKNKKVNLYLCSMKQQRFYIFCDESIKKGKYYSNFYGGLLIDAKDYDKVNNLLLSKLQDLNIENSELKWSIVNTFGVQNYIEMMDVFFEFIKQNIIKFRIMFTDNRFLSQSLPSEYYKKEYHILYYQFLKHSFGFSYLHSDIPIELEFFFDELPR